MSNDEKKKKKRGSETTATKIFYQSRAEKLGNRFVYFIVIIICISLSDSKIDMLLFQQS